MPVKTIRTAVQQWHRYSHRLPGQWWRLFIIPLSMWLAVARILPITPTRHIGSDPSVFYYGGNLLANGYVPYLHLWDVKPPLIYHVTGVLSLLFPGEIWYQFYAGSLLTQTLAVGSICLVGGIVYRMTRSDFAAVGAGLAVLAYPSFIVIGAAGVWPKHFAIFCGLLSLYALTHDRHVVAGVAGAASAGFWQFGAIFALIALLVSYRAGYPVRRVLGGMVGMTAIAVAPIVLAGAGKPMIYEVVLEPFVMADQSTGLLGRLEKLQRFDRYGWPVVLGGAFAGAYRVVKDRELWWFGLGLAWATGHLWMIDFDGVPDPMLFVVFAAIGLGLFIGKLTVKQQVAVVCAVLILTGGQLISFRGRFIKTPSKDPGDTIVKRHFVEQTLPPETCWISKAVSPAERAAYETPPKLCGQIPPWELPSDPGHLG